MTDRVDTDLAKALGDRHLRDAAVRPSRLGAVRLLADEAIASSRAGQHALWMLMNLLARQFAIIEELVVEVPRLRLHDHVDPFGDAPAELGQALVALGQEVAGAAMRIRLGSCTREPDLDVVVGHSERCVAGGRVGVLGDGWRAMVGPPDSVPTELPTSDLPFGPYFAACLGAAEVFKVLCGSSPQEVPFFYSVWEGATAPTWISLLDGPLDPVLVLPPAYLIGVGAVGQGFLATIVALDKVEAHFVTIDKDVIDRTNLNRYPLARQRDVDTAKVAIAAHVLRERGIDVLPYDGLWPDYAHDSSRPRTREDLDVLERSFRYRQVISCVDGNKARHDIQRFWPEHILGASTQGMRLTVASYDLGAGDECLMCANPVAPEPTVQDVVEEIGRMPAESRRLLAAQRGIPLETLESYLTDPRCGLLGPSELRHFSEHARADWSVGFVSVAAGVMAAARLSRQALEGITGAWAAGNSLWFTFRPTGTRWMRFTRRPECECGRSMHHYDRLWR